MAAGERNHTSGLTVEQGWVTHQLAVKAVAIADPEVETVQEVVGGDRFTVVEAGAGAQLAGDAAALVVNDAALGEGGLGPGGVGQPAGQALEEEIVDGAAFYERLLLELADEMRSSQ